MHSHSHSHQHQHNLSGRLRLALLITCAFLVVEVAGGIIANSLALLADAGHMVTDAGALALSLFSVWFSRHPVTPSKSFGYLRWEIIASLINGSALLLVCGWIAWEAIARLGSPEPVGSGLMAGVAAAGLVANGVSAWVLRPATSHNLNARGAYLHVMGDLLSSVGTLIAALIIAFTGFLAADPIVSLLTAALIVRSAWHLVRESVDVLLEATPAHISSDAVRRRMEGIEGIESVHDLHIWSVASGMIAMSAHAIVREPEMQQQVLEQIHDAVGTFGIHHVTVQLEQREMFEREMHLHD
jgi:cobalt-zinc-cadmium efflux system protein